MKKDIRDLLEGFEEETVNIEAYDKASPDRIAALVKCRIKEDNMNISGKKVRHIPLIAAAVALILSVTVFAAYNFMSPADVAKLFEDEKLADSFDNGDIKFDFEPQISGGYVFRLIGIMSGKNLSKYSDEVGVKNDKSYIVGSIEKEDGTALTDYPDIMVTPLVSGFKPWQVNAFTLGRSGRQDVIEDGVDYFIFECDNIEIFADHTIYIAAYEGLAPGADEFSMADDGSISFNENYTGAKALFVVPIDKSKADPKAVAEFIESNDIADNHINISATDEENLRTEYHRFEIQEDDLTGDIVVSKKVGSGDVSMEFSVGDDDTVLYSVDTESEKMTAR